jgi:hypothetical protein
MASIRHGGEPPGLGDHQRGEVIERHRLLRCGSVFESGVERRQIAAQMCGDDMQRSCRLADRSPPGASVARDQRAT